MDEGLKNMLNNSEEELMMSLNFFTACSFRHSQYCSNKANKKVLERMEDCILWIYDRYNIGLTYENIVEFVRHFGDNPRGIIESEIDSFMVDIDINDMDEALMSLPEYNCS